MKQEKSKFRITNLTDVTKIKCPVCSRVVPDWALAFLRDGCKLRCIICGCVFHEVDGEILIVRINNVD